MRRLNSTKIVFSTLLLMSFITYAGYSNAGDNHILYDGHIHYDQDVWESLPPAQAIELLQEQNIARALVSATPTEGAEMLYKENPDIVIPMLRPYKNWRHRHLWFKDPELKEYLIGHLNRVPYKGFGEFHVFGKNSDTKPIDDMFELAREGGLAIHPHTNLEGIKIFLEKSKGLPIIWAHGGFNTPIKTLRQLMDKYPSLIIELSLREGMLDKENNLTNEWKEFLTEYQKRFLTGMDTYKPSRWADLPEIAEETRHWLQQLPTDVADDIARNNLDRLFPRE